MTLDAAVPEPARVRDSNFTDIYNPLRLGHILGTSDAFGSSPNFNHTSPACRPTQEPLPHKPVMIPNFSFGDHNPSSVLLPETVSSRRTLCWQL